VTRRQPAQAIVWVAVLLPTVFLPVLGFSIDAGVVFDARRELQNVADGAARAGAMEIDRSFLHGPDNPLGEVRLDPDEAEEAAESYLRRARFDGQSSVNASTRRIEVTVRRRLNPPFLRILRAPPIDMRATGQARPCSGATQQTSNCQ
jgi:hypothetical protein